MDGSGLTSQEFYVAISGYVRFMHPLGAYMQTHLAGSRAGIDLFARSARAQRDPAVGRELADLLDEVTRERDALAQIMRSIGVSENLVRSLSARVGGRITALAPHGNPFKRSFLDDFVDLETMRIAVSGKQAGWEALLAIANDVEALDPEQLSSLVAQGRSQLQRLADLHTTLAKRALP